MNDYNCKQCRAAVDDMEAFMIRESGLCSACYNAGPGKEHRAIREEDKLDEAWFAKAKEVRTPEQLVAFMRQVMDGYIHDYGTVCKAIAACALAASWCANRMEGGAGGITGFQSGAVFWEYARRWQGIDGPARLMRYSEMLFPQHEVDFARTITPLTADWLRAEAGKLLAEGGPSHPEVVAHWKKIAEGNLPWSFEVRP